VLLLQKQVLTVPFLCFFSSVSHPLSLNLTRFSPLLFAINFFLSWGLGAATIMQRYFKRKVSDGPSPSTDQQCLNWEDEIEFDPGKRKEISKYHPNIRDVVRRKYLENGPCQPRTLDFPSTKIGGKNRRFNTEWFDEFGSWLEYSESSDQAYCFPCFLMRGRSKKEAGYEEFVVDGWNSWNNPSRLKDHVGGVGGPHNEAQKNCDALLKREQHIDIALH
jgi:hypothetical protein